MPTVPIDKVSAERKLLKVQNDENIPTIDILSVLTVLFKKNEITKKS